MAQTAYDPYFHSRIAVGAQLDITPQTATLKPENTETTGDLTADSITWHNLADIILHQIENTREDDPLKYWDHVAKVWTTDPQTKVVGNTLTFECADYTPLFHAILHGVKNPDTTDYSAGAKVPVYANSDPAVPYCIRLARLNAKGELLETQYFYAKISVTDAVQMDDKTIRPKVTLTVQPSVHNVSILTQVLTGQTGSDDPPPNGGEEPNGGETP